MLVEVINKHTKQTIKIHEKLADYVIKRQPNKFGKVEARGKRGRKAKATYQTKDMVAE